MSFSLTLTNPLGALASTCLSYPNGGYPVLAGAYQAPGQIALPSHTDPEGEMDGQQITAHLFAGCPTMGHRPVPDGVYPLDLDITSPHIRFHLLTWRYSDAVRAGSMWQMIEITAPVTGDYSFLHGERLAFLTRHDRSCFQRWWTGYSKRFFAGDAPVHQFLPRLQPGRYRATFVAHSSALEHAKGQWLMAMLADWTWIVAQCRRPVCRVSNGWLFDSATEAAKFTLFSPQPLADAATD